MPENEVSVPFSPSISPIKPLDYSAAPAIRGVWLTTIYGLDWPNQQASSAIAMKRQREELCRILDRLAAQNFNTVFLQVRLRGDLIYPSSKEPLSTILTGSRSKKPDYDPLDFAVKECHKRGLSLHAWLVTLPIGTDKHVRQIGNKGVWGKHRSWCIAHKGEWYLDAGLPEVRSYIADLTTELAQRYDIDGVHFDYIRYPENANSFKDDATYRKYGKGASKKVWRKRNISALIKESSQSVRAAKPHILVSAATLGKLRVLSSQPRVGWTCQESVYQDPVEWHREGSVDFIVPMMYYKEHLFDPFLFDWKSQIPQLPIVPGLGVYRVDDESRWSASVIGSQLALIAREKMAGVCFYREENIRPNRKGIDKVIDQYFTAPVRMYPFRNRHLPIPPEPTNLRVSGEGEYRLVQWDMPKEWQGRATYNIFIRSKKRENQRVQDNLIASLVYDCEVYIPKSLLSGAEYVRIEAANRLFVVGGISAPLFL